MFFLVQNLVFEIIHSVRFVNNKWLIQKDLVVYYPLVLPKGFSRSVLLLTISDFYPRESRAEKDDLKGGEISFGSWFQS